MTPRTSRDDFSREDFDDLWPGGDFDAIEDLLYVAYHDADGPRTAPY